MTMWTRAALLAATLTLAACKEDLYTGLTEQDANEMISVLYRVGIPADRVVDAGGLASVRVDRGRFQEAVEALRAEGYPKPSYQTMGDVFQGNGFVVSHMEERARFIYALSEELSRTVAEIDGVIGARTHVVLPTSDPMSRDVTPSSASVVIRHLDAAPVARLAPQIKMLVANSIEGLSYDNVSVVFIPVAAPPAAAPPAEVGPARAPEAGMAWIVGGLGALVAILLLAMARGRLRHRREIAAREIEIVPVD